MTDSDAQDKVCSECGCDVSFYYAPDDPVDSDDDTCLVCQVQEHCAGSCGITDEMARSLDVRIVARIGMVLDMVESLEDAMGTCLEIAMTGREPRCGLDVDLSEHHITSGVAERTDAASSELGGVIRSLVRTLPPLLMKHQREASYVFSHHPSGRLTGQILATYM